MLRRLLTTFVATVLVGTGVAGTAAAGTAAVAAPPAAVQPGTAVQPAPAGLPATNPDPLGKARVCTDLREIGRPGYVRWHNMTILSVREWASRACGQRYAEAYAWRQFRAEHVKYELGVAIFDSTHDRYLGARQFAAAGGPAYWTTGVTPRAACTSAIVEIWLPGDDLGTFSTSVC